jgi:hypothetical protein
MDELLDGPDIVKFIKFKRLQWASHIVQMDNSRIPKKVLDRKYHGRRPVGRPQLRWEDNIRRDSLLLDGGDGQGIGISGGELLKRPWPDEGCHAIEEEE